MPSAIHPSHPVAIIIKLTTRSCVAVRRVWCFAAPPPCPERLDIGVKTPLRIRLGRCQIALPLSSPITRHNSFPPQLCIATHGTCQPFLKMYSLSQSMRTGTCSLGKTPFGELVAAQLVQCTRSGVRLKFDRLLQGSSMKPSAFCLTQAYGHGYLMLQIVLSLCGR